MRQLPLAICILLCGAFGRCYAEAPRPNILYFYVDDMGWGSIGPNGQDKRKEQGLPYVRTPNLNRLASEGVNFTRGYGCHVCSPARSSQQTGFHQGHTFADRNDPNNAKKAIRKEDITIGDALSQAGYVTGYWGKWGYGGSKDRQNPTIDNLQTLPTSHGYKFVLAELHHVRAHTFFQPTLWSAPAKPDVVGGLELKPNSMAAYVDEKRFPQSPAMQGHPDYPRTAYCDDSYAFAALEFVRSQAQNYNKSGQPFMGLLAVQIPHAPFGEISTLPEWDRHYSSDSAFDSLSDQTKQWAAMVTRIDAHFGNILAALEDPNGDGDKSDSVANETLVIFQSDNGGPAGKNNLELNANGGLTGNKGKIQEGGIRVPLVMRWPAMINQESDLRAGTSTDQVVDVTDLLPTLCELAGVTAPLGIDGVSIAPTLTGTGHQRKRKYIIHEASNGNSIIRGNYKLVAPKRGKPQLHDLAADPTESKNIASKHPELVKYLSTQLAAERVNEPKGFSNTYHHWIGASSDDMSDEKNWSDYSYSNAGVVYQEDTGSPQLSWTATIRNTSESDQELACSGDLEFLALEIAGDHSTDVEMSLSIPSDRKITGRNEIRICAGSDLNLDGGTASTERWLGILSDGRLSGNGTIEGDVYCSGHCEPNSSGGGIEVSGDFHFSGESTLTTNGLRNETQAVINVSGNCSLSGKLEVTLPKAMQIEQGTTFVVVQAKSITGKFSNSDSLVTASNGKRFAIEYGKSGVWLIAK